MKGIIYIDTRKCLGCKTCEIQCAVSHSESKTLLALQSANTVTPRIRVEEYSSASIPIQCCHCEEAPCISVCPKKAISRDATTSAVVIDEGLCIGCGFCIIACPYGIPEEKKDADGRKKAIKCDLCFKRTKGSLPVCVEACPTRALEFIEEKNTASDDAAIAGSCEPGDVQKEQGKEITECRKCGKALPSAALLKTLKKKFNIPDVVLYTCRKCKRAFYAEQIKSRTKFNGG